MAGEGSLQKYFKAQASTHGVLWRKMKWEGRRGAPDVFLAKNGRTILVEEKNLDGTGVLSKIQVREIARLRKAGVDVRVIDSKEGVDDVIAEINRC